MQINLKFKPVYSCDGFDPFGRAYTRDAVFREISNRQLRIMGNPVTVFYTAEKHRQTNRYESKYGKIHPVRTHWKFKIYAIDNSVIAALKALGKKIIQVKNGHQYGLKIVPINRPY